MTTATFICPRCGAWFEDKPDRIFQCMNQAKGCWKVTMRKVDKQ